MPYIKPTVRNHRMGPVLPRIPLRNLEKTDRLKFRGVRLDQSKIALIILVAVKHPVGIDNRSFVMPRRFVHYFSRFPLLTDPVAPGVGAKIRSVNIAVHQHHVAVMGNQKFHPSICGLLWFRPPKAPAYNCRHCIHWSYKLNHRDISGSPD